MHIVGTNTLTVGFAEKQKQVLTVESDPGPGTWSVVSADPFVPVTTVRVQGDWCGWGLVRNKALWFRGEVLHPEHGK